MFCSSSRPIVLNFSLRNFLCLARVVEAWRHVLKTIVESEIKIKSTSSGARAMHGFGAEVFIEEVRKCNDMMIYSTGVSFLATILNPWFLSGCFRN